MTEEKQAQSFITESKSFGQKQNNRSFKLLRKLKDKGQERHPLKKTNTQTSPLDFLPQKLQETIGSKDEGAPHNHYFSQLNQQLKSFGPGHPKLVIDLDRVDQNLQTAKKYFNPRKRPRIVVKSLPSPKLVAYMMKGLDTNRLMVFHLPFLLQVVDTFPDSDVLLGKPLPLQAVERFYDLQVEAAPFNPQQQLQWLVDTKDRLIQYLELAKRRRLNLKINFEIDVGLHRGGFDSPEALAEALEILEQNPEHLTLGGLMGYDPHVAKAPSPLSSIEKAFTQATKRYRLFIQVIETQYPSLYAETLTFNGAGSPTYQLYENEQLLNDLSLGSSLVKPTDFDIGTIKAHVDAVFIATPVLKKLSGVKIPYLEWANETLQKINPNLRESFFIYGGYWMAKPVSPAGLRKNSLFGNSSNQEIMNGSERTQLNVDDYVFLRPTQSEAVLLQFGDLLIYKNGKIEDQWPVFKQ